MKAGSRIISWTTILKLDTVYSTSYVDRSAVSPTALEYSEYWPLTISTVVLFCVLAKPTTIKSFVIVILVITTVNPICKSLSSVPSLLMKPMDSPTKNGNLASAAFPLKLLSLDTNKVVNAEPSPAQSTSVPTVSP